MSGLPINSSFYSVGGPLLQDDPSYLTRESDTELYETLKAGKFCYVLNSRQMGKSSLMVRTLAKLEADGWVGSIIDFSGKDSQVDRPDRWYNGIINQLNNQFELLEWQTFRTWLKERDFIAPVERLADFIETVLLPAIEQPIVIFIDEIDSTLGLPFTDDFFALIRVCFNKRPQNSAYQRLTFALLGVAAPSELIGDAKRTPFNVGESIDLKGFTPEEALPLVAGLQGKAEQPETVLQEILQWTGGQPFLTQRLCQLVVDSNEVIETGSEAVTIDRLVESRLIDNWEAQDNQEHLKTIRKRLLDNEQKAGYLLELYRQIRQAGELVADNQPEERELQLSGLIVKRDGKLRVYNPIYKAVFDETWIDGELRKLRPYAESFRAWVVSGKADNSRLLRGGALTEAEEWASEKTTLSAEDREFLAASRAQQREEEIAIKERVAELERERTARGAAEAAEQIQAKATREAQRKIRRGSLVLGGTLAVALVLGGLALGAGNRFREANNQLVESQNEKKQIDQDLRQAQKQVKTTQKERDQANKELAQSQENLQAVETQRQKADEKLKQAQQATQGQQALLTQLRQDLVNADVAVAQAKKAEQEAQRKADQVANDLVVAQQKLEKVNQEQQEIAVLNSTTKALSGLIDDLYAIDKPEVARDSIELIGLSFTDFTSNSSELKQVLLNSSTALAHLHLIPFPSNDANEESQKQVNDAQTLIKQNIQLIEANPDLFNSSVSGRAIAFFTFAVQGNLREEQDYLREKQDPTSAYPSYEKAFRYISETPYFNSESVEHTFENLRYSFSSDESKSVRFQTLLAATLKKHYDFQSKQLIRELEQVLAQYQWRDADRLTTKALVASAYSIRWGGSFAYSNVACSSLQEIDALWFEHSAGRFSFRVQKDIYEETNNISAQFSEASWIRFAHEIGWNRINENIEELLGSHDERIEWLLPSMIWPEELVDGTKAYDIPIDHIPMGYLPGVFSWDLEMWWTGQWRLLFSRCEL
ncbi:AAA-like domain-containing protein [Leptothoe sp. ISB3NOV94-8A]